MSSKISQHHLDANTYSSHRSKLVDSIHYTPIGIIHSPFQTSEEAPRQPGLSDNTEGLVKVHKAKLYIRGLDFIEGAPVLDIKPYYQISTENLPKEEKSSREKT
jgi:tRNA (Thr-GGU) A37 N-methylase